MRRPFASAFAATLLLLAACGGAEDDRSASERSGTTATPEPVDLPAPAFEDDFDDPSFTDTAWARCYHWQPTNCTNEWNEELEAYVPEGVAVEDGELHLTAREATNLTGYLSDNTPRSFPYSSGLVTTFEHFDFLYGFVEVRAKVPAGIGLWPAVWLLPSDHQTPPEIDLMEYVGQDADMTYHTVHFRGGGSGDVPVDHGRPVADDYHVYALHWTPDGVSFAVDGVLRGAVTESVPDTPMYLLANLAVGGVWPGPPDGDTAFPATFAVDYVRVWTGAAADVVAAVRMDG